MKIAIIGQGGHSKVVRDVIKAMGDAAIVGCLDDKFNAEFFHEQIIYGPVNASKSIVEDFPEVKFVVAIGNNTVRKQIVDQLGFPEEFYATLIHPTAQISSDAIVGPGSVVMPCAVVNSDAQLGAHTIINTCAVVEHDSKIENFVHISPNATLTGNVTVREGAQIGASATVIPGIEIGKWAIVGAGATVIHNIPPNSTAVGVPAIVKIREVTGGV
ncbi:acetyltransferase [Bacillus sp. ISL-35]|uniref:acetyltransferase n=1 Tax=Bacillus sp. ISL-35 TaxID=2819122 RepID=UPI001BECE336|nr:acetyltransferase [Bacillus sp. ISL-35]MBT2679823.1 acetyltransferase [Bacillus sp. ISL-35]MBT2704858.1 acetyltransferase [Chryseobacterium sp. ISL-80]